MPCWTASAMSLRQCGALDSSPRIEDHLVQVDDRLRTALLEELMAQEVDLRRKAGEEVEIQEYLDRFPDNQDGVRRGFALAPERPSQPTMSRPAVLPKQVTQPTGPRRQTQVHQCPRRSTDLRSGESWVRASSA